MTQVFHWRIGRGMPAPSTGYVERKGQPCEVIARGALGSIAVRFDDGGVVITSRRAVRARGREGAGT